MTGTNTPEPEANSANSTSSPSSWSEEAIERLLRDFYRAEMPPALREPADAEESWAGLAAPVEHSANPTQPSRWLRAAGVVSGGLVALGMLIAVMQWAGSPDQTGTLSDGQGRTDDRSQRGTDDRATLGRGPADRGLADRAPVESRDALRPVARDAADGPGPGGHEINEWDIIVFPIDEPAPMPPGASRPDRPAVAEPAPRRPE